ncbi:MAG: hypothetical protein WBB01_08280 [Phormidesmis sp.]
MGFHSSDAAQPFADCSHSSGPSQDSRPDTVDAIDTFLAHPDRVMLPPIRVDTVVSQRHEVNPALALNLLQDIQTVVTIWQKQLRQIVKAIHLLCAQGPMVDGWLESSLEAAKAESAADSLVWRHGETEALLQQVAALEAGHSEARTEGTPASASAQYRLCSLDTEGKLRSQPCPPGQMAVVSTAIARYQKFKQLTLRKQAIEVKLQRAVDGLSGVRTDLQ